MAVIDLKCPNCGKAMKVPDTAAGKKLRCKACEAIFTVPAAAAKPLPAEFKKPAPAKAKPAKPAAPPPADAPIKFLDDEPKKKPADDDDDEANPYGVVKEGEVPRCPHCAVELDPPDTRVCLNCGYDMVQRRRHESKKVYAHTGADYALHWLPAVIWLLVLIGMITLTVICFMQMDSWMEGSFLQKDDKNAVTGKPEFYVGPGCFIMLVTLITLALLATGGRFVVKRLILNWKPEEVEKRK